MGMLIDGVWQETIDRFMKDGIFQREVSSLVTPNPTEISARLINDRSQVMLVASKSCPWSHGAVIAMILSGLPSTIPIQWCGGPRLEGYTMLETGPLSSGGGFQFVHQLYGLTDKSYTGRATVPVLWDAQNRKILSNDSSVIMRCFNEAGDGPDLYAPDQRSQIDAVTEKIFSGLSNAVYQAGLAETQAGYDAAVNHVFDTLDWLEQRMENRRALLGNQFSTADIRLFACLVRFDTVYATHFRCTRKRLTDYRNLWRFTRQFYHLSGIKETVDFDEIRFGYYVNDGQHNPHKIIAQQPAIDWDDESDFLD